MERSPSLASRAAPSQVMLSQPNWWKQSKRAAEQRDELHSCFPRRFPFPALVYPPTVPGEKTGSDGTLLCSLTQEDIWAVTG